MKLDRAEELIGDLTTEVAQVRADNYLTFKIVHNGGIGIRVQVQKQPPFDRWGVLIGETVHDLRSTLDHLTWALTIAHSGPPHGRLTRWWREVEFPIFTDHDAFRRTGLRDLQGVDPALIPTFEGLQPFHRAQPDRHPLAILHALSILDKHQTLPLVAIASRHGVIRTQHGPFTGRSRIRRVPAPIEDGALIASLTKTSGRATEDEAPKVGDVLRVTYGIQIDYEYGFATGPPAFGGELIPTLVRLHRATARVLRKLGDPRLF